MSGGLKYVIIDEITWCKHTIVTPIRKILSSKQKKKITEEMQSGGITPDTTLVSTSWGFFFGNCYSDCNESITPCP